MLQGPLENLIQELSPKPSCIVSTNAIPWTQKVAQKFNIPRYNFETVSCFTLLCSHKLSEVRESDSESLRVPNICHEIEFTNAQLPKASKSDSNGFQDVIDEIKRARDSARGTLVNTFQELEPWYLDNYRDVVGNVWSIGPVSLCNKENSEKSNRGNEAAIDEHYCLTWLDSMRPKSVIYACFGSLCRISAQQTKEIGLGLEKSGFPFVWIIRKQDCSEEVEEVKGRGLVIRGWAPQVLILSHPSVGGFLTHCGWNSTLEGICAGVPMITWPMFAEQFFNEKFVVSVLGIGVRVGVESCMDSEGLVEWDRVRIAIEKVMDESEDGMERRMKAEEIAKVAKNAVEKGGSSYLNLTRLIQDVIEQVQQ
ncbi:UDP-glycosyltransferase 73c5 [Phtheirospermum japonicum]|uniref:UDP-glycosyltransferase 73c5 n=1 Tax=Phtheirospermum japonicum TaxID=374723 RepID=A0A830C4P1_9LAMI|nr:UDP-glycosyltransferase 73c5 [Phtheirospermum japonicum]GFP91234.1 UDP-glycosyltransferase 73c5 [Phtheirospermum japonicum]